MMRLSYSINQLANLFSFGNLSNEFVLVLLWPIATQPKSIQAIVNIFYKSGEKTRQIFSENVRILLFCSNSSMFQHNRRSSWEKQPQLLS